VSLGTSGTRRNPEGRMSLGAHLREARRRFLLVGLGITVGAIVGWILYDRVFAALQAPIAAVNDAGRTAALNFEGIATSFDIRLRVALFVGIILASPWWLYQTWAFVAPGLTSREKRTSLAFFAAGVPLFAAGAATAWFFLPHAVNLLTEFTPSGSVNFINASVYLGFVMQLVLAFGLAFLLPLVMVALTHLGLVRARTWARGWRWAVIVVFAFAAVATPTPDAVSMILVAVPITALYFGALGVCVLIDRRAGHWVLTPGDEDATE
jgi:sec-independent protein translocase protein TatC